MANKILTFVDASVLIYAANKSTALTLARRMRALQVLGDPDREFLASKYLRLEVLPMAVCYHKSREVAFYQKFFEGAALRSVSLARDKYFAFFAISITPLSSSFGASSSLCTTTFLTF